MWAKLYEIENVSTGLLDGATVSVWKDGDNYMCIIGDDPNYNGTYYKSSAKSGDNFDLIEFDEFADDNHLEYFTPSNHKGIIYVTPEGVAIVTAD